MKIDRKRLKELELAEMKLNALEVGGVDNWEFYGDALDEFNKSLEKIERVEKIVNELCEIICENIEQPAGSGCGYGVTKEGIEIMSDLLEREILK